MLTIGVESRFIEDGIRECGRPVSAGRSLLHELRCERPMLNSGNHVFPNAEASNCIFVGEH